MSPKLFLIVTSVHHEKCFIQQLSLSFRNGTEKEEKYRTIEKM